MTLEFIIGKDNSQKIRLRDTSSGSWNDTNTTAVNRMSLSFGNVLADTIDNPAYFDYSANDGTVEINIGSHPNLVEGVYNDAELTVYSPDHPNGILWLPKFTVKVH